MGSGKPADLCNISRVFTACTEKNMEDENLHIWQQQMAVHAHFDLHQKQDIWQQRMDVHAHFDNYFKLLFMSHQTTLIIQHQRL